MDFILFVWEYLIPFLILLTVLVFFHELGHYWIARRNNVRVEVFSVGFGPELWGRTDRLGTRWKFAAVPIGGYVKFFGDSGEHGSIQESLDAMTPEERAVAFHAKTVGQRAAIVAAGPIANLALAFVLLYGIYLAIGVPDAPAEVGTVVEDSAAEAAGLQPGDRIVAIQGNKVDHFEDIRVIVALHPEEPLEFVVVRDGREMTLSATPEAVEVENELGETERIGRLGIVQEIGEYRRLGPIDAAVAAVEQIGSFMYVMRVALGQIVVGSRSSKELGGPVLIAQLSGKMWELGLVAFIGFMAMLSVNLGLINLFPIPLLDGGHLLFCAVEWIRGKPVADRIQEFSLRIGLALLLSLMIFVTWNDLSRLEFFQWIGGLFS